jgi:hypothetical protein
MGGTAGEVAQAILAATLQEISAKAAVQAAYYAALALGLQATTMGIPNPGSVMSASSAASFALLAGGISVGAGIASAAVAPDVRGRLRAEEQAKEEREKALAGAGGSSGVGFGGGGTGWSSGGGSGQTNVTVFLEAGGGLIEDHQYRRLGEVVEEAGRRGYMQGAR